MTTFNELTGFNHPGRSFKAGMRFGGGGGGGGGSSYSGVSGDIDTSRPPTGPVMNTPPYTPYPTYSPYTPAYDLATANSNPGYMMPTAGYMMGAAAPIGLGSSFDWGELTGATYTPIPSGGDFINSDGNLVNGNTGAVHDPHGSGDDLPANNVFQIINGEKVPAPNATRPVPRPDNLGSGDVNNDGDPTNDTGNAGWGFTSLADMFDGGGPGASGDSYTGGIHGSNTVGNTANGVGSIVSDIGDGDSGDSGGANGGK